LVTPQTLDKARGINEQLRALVAQDFAPEKFTELNEQFHSALSEHHQNPHTLDLVHRGRNRLAALRSSTYSFVLSRPICSVAAHEHQLTLIADGAEFSVIELAARNHRLNTLNAYLNHHAKSTTIDF